MKEEGSDILQRLFAQEWDSILGPNLPLSQKSFH